MDEFIKLLDPSLNYIEHITKDKKCIITVESNRKDAICPYCGMASSKKHSMYKKEFQDFVEGVEGAGSREGMISAIEEMLGGAR